MAPGDSAPAGLSGRSSRVIALGMLGLVRLYRLAIGSWLPPVCRFEPTCSRYAEEAIRRYGPWRGGLLGGRRLLRCHPFHPGGPDPVR